MSVSLIIPMSDKIIFGLTSEWVILLIEFLSASLDPCTSDFKIIFSSSLLLSCSKILFLSWARILGFVLNAVFWKSFIFFASSSLSTTKNSPPELADSFIPSISTGVEG